MSSFATGLSRDEYWMMRAVELARTAWGYTHPNPLVGAVLTKGDEWLSEGYHRQAGKAHAEVEALRDYSGSVPEGSTLYVTMEPCSSEGRTPPCTRRILEAGVRRVVVGCTDPDLRHRGRGLDILRESGVETICGVLEDSCRDLNLIFHWHAETGKPLIAAKMATTIDGRTATAGGHSRWITGDESRRNVHFWRTYFPAIAVGAGTVLADDPSLTARNAAHERCPIRLIFDRSGLLAKVPDRCVFTDAYRDKTVLFTRALHLNAFRKQLNAKIRIQELPEGNVGEFLSEWLLTEGLHGLYVEGGSRLLGNFFSRRQIDYLFAYRAPLLFLDSTALPPATGRTVFNTSDALVLDRSIQENFGKDQLLRGFVRYPEGNH